jgi:hypothetical protein
MKLTKTHPLFETFIRLTCALSPENLTCDGECSRSEVRARHASLMREWRNAEKKFGGPVTESDVWNAELSR